MSDRRPTPLDPYPQPRPSQERGVEKAYPPELGTDAIAVLEGRTFMFSDVLGDVPAGSVCGLMHDDTRLLSCWDLTLNGRQAWATGAPFAFLAAMLGMEIRDGEVQVDPFVPEELGRVFVHGIHAFGTHWDIEASGRSGHVRLSH